MLVQLQNFLLLIHQNNPNRRCIKQPLKFIGNFIQFLLQLNIVRQLPNHYTAGFDFGIFTHILLAHKRFLTSQLGFEHNIPVKCTGAVVQLFRFIGNKIVQSFADGLIFFYLPIVR